MTNLNISIPQEFHTTGVHKLPRIHKPPSNYGCQKSKMKFHTENPQFWSDLWTSRLFGALSTASELIRTFQYAKKSCYNHAESIWQHCTNFHFLGSQALGICTPLLYDNEALNSTLNFILRFSPQKKQIK
jgi:hypothetical protein